MNQTPTSEVATLAGGCFWCLEAAFREIDGVEDVTPGYTGGAVPNPTYEQVCTGTTGHAEAVQVTFDPARLSYRDILAIFFSIHEPTTLNRQGADTGTQYRSAIFYRDERQKAAAEALIRELEGAHLWDDTIVTRVERLERFYPAEDYHREYFREHPEQMYCRAVIAPKVSKLRRHWARRLGS